MAFYEQTMGAYPTVESPLSRFDHEEIYFPERRPSAAISPQQLMPMILGIVAVLIITAVFIRPKIVSNEANEAGSETAVQTQTAAQTQLDLAAPNANQETSAPAAAPLPAKGEGEGGISPIFSPQVQYWAPQIVGWASQHNLDPDIVATIMQIESCGDPQAASHAGAQGLFQVMPFHFAPGEQMLDPDTNARRGMTYYAERLIQTGGNVYQAFAGYNGGHVAAAGNWNTWANETQRYYTWSKGIYDDAKAGLAESPTLQQWMQAGGASLCQQASNRLALQ